MIIQPNKGSGPNEVNIYLTDGRTIVFETTDTIEIERVISELCDNRCATMQMIVADNFRVIDPADSGNKETNKLNIF